MDDVARIPLKDGRKILLKCEVVTDIPDNLDPKKTVVAERTRTFKLDSGSQVTCIPASMLDLYVSEKEYLDWADAHRTEGIKPFSITCKGIDSSSSGIRGYYMQTERFSVQGLELGSVPIYVVFDERYKKILLGMDLIRLMNVHMDNDSEVMELTTTRKYLEFRKNHLRTTIKSMFEMGIYSKKDSDKSIALLLSEGDKE